MRKKINSGLSGFTLITKNADIWTVTTPASTSWVIRKIFDMRKLMPSIITWNNVIEHGKFSMKKTYMSIRGDYAKVPWKSITI